MMAVFSAFQRGAPRAMRSLASEVAVSGAVSDIRIAAIGTTGTAFVLRVILDAAARLSIQ